METVLIVVTLASLTAAIAALAVTRRVVCRERGRSAARVAALVQAAGPPEDVAGFALTTDLQPDVQSPQAGPEDPLAAGRRARRTGAAGIRPAVRDGAAPRQRLPSPRTGAGRRSADRGRGGRIDHRGCQPRRRQSPGRGRGGRAGAGGRRRSAGAAGARTRARRGGAHDFGHGAQPVRRPPDPGARAAVSLLDRDGALLSRRDVPLDVLTLEPGRQSTFSLRTPRRGERHALPGELPDRGRRGGPARRSPGPNGNRRAGFVRVRG